MKKALLITLICTIFLTFTACSTTENETKPSTDIDVNTDEESDNDAITDDETATDPETDEDLDSDTNNDNSLVSLIDTIYAATGLEIPRLMKSPLTKENQAYMLGVDNFDFVEGFASEPMISAQAHSVVLFVVEESSDIEAIKEDIRANVDGYKWICVGVETENIIVDSKDNMIILIMDDNAATIHEAFLTTVN